MPESLSEANVQAFLAQYRDVRDQGGRLFVPTSHVLDLGRSMLVWDRRLDASIAEVVGLLELGIRIGAFPETASEYDDWHRLALSILEREQVQRTTSLPALLGSFELRLGFGKGTNLLVDGRARDRAFGFFASVRNVLDFFHTGNGGIALELCLGRPVRFGRSRRGDPDQGASPLELGDIFFGLAQAARNPSSEDAFSDTRRDTAEYPIPLSACLEIVESFTCLDDAVRMKSELKLPVEEDVFDPSMSLDLALVSNGAAELLDFVVCDGQPERVRHFVGVFFTQLQRVGESAEPFRGPTDRPSVGELGKEFDNPDIEGSPA